MADEVMESVIETIDNASKHKLQLAELTQSLAGAKEQVTSTSRKSKKQIENYFSELRLHVNKALDARMKELIREVEHIETESVGPLVECEAMIQKGMQDATTLLNEGKLLLMGEADNKEKLEAFKCKADTMAPNSLPEVPVLCDVACISVELGGSLGEQMLGAVAECGRVHARAPVQITDVTERPGALLIKWAEADDCSLDFTSYRLQYCYGRASNDEDTGTVFNDVYIGQSTNHVVRELQCDKDYTFRVCSTEGDSNWLPWSLPHIASTSLPHHQWSTTTEGFKLSHDNQIAASRRDNRLLICSNAATYICGHSLVFKVLQMGSPDDEGGLGIMANNTAVSDKSLCKHGAFFITMGGSIFIDGKEKVTKLPSLTKGASVTIDTEVLQKDKVRVTIETGDKSATFDWTVEEGDNNMTPVPGISMGAIDPDINLYFAFSVNCEGWKIAVL